MSLSPDFCVSQTETAFAKVGPWSLPFAKFFPGLSIISVAMAGVTKISLPAFLFAQRNWGVLVCERARRPGPDISRRNSTSARLSVKIVTNWSDPTRMPNLAGAASLLSVGAHAQRSPLVSWGSGQPLAHSENLLGVPRRKAVTLRQSLTSCQAALGRRASSLGAQIRAPTLQRRLQPVPLPYPDPLFEPIRWLFPYRIRMQENSARFVGFPSESKVVTRMFHPAGISRHHAPQLSSANDLPYTN